LPQHGELKIVGKLCDACQTPKVMVKTARGWWELCPNLECPLALAKSADKAAGVKSRRSTVKTPAKQTTKAATKTTSKSTARTATRASTGTGKPAKTATDESVGITADPSAKPSHETSRGLE
jgi:hypothetical protein